MSSLFPRESCIGKRVVLFPRTCAPSGELLNETLLSRGYNGPVINWGTGAHVVNKLEARRIFRDKGVNAPPAYFVDEGFQYIPAEMGALIGRRSRHRKGRGFFIVSDSQSYNRVMRFKNPPSHFLKLIEVEREFRVHVVGNSSIKMSEKIGGEGIVRSFENGYRFHYPHDLDRSLRSSIRELARESVSVLGYPFGAVDILLSNGVPYVTEVNAAPCLTDEKSDTLQRYVDAFMKEYHDPDSEDRATGEAGEGSVDLPSVRFRGLSFDKLYSEVSRGFDGRPYPVRTAGV